MCSEAQKNKNHINVDKNSQCHHFVNFQFVPFINADT